MAMKLSFATQTGDRGWSPEECADWARDHGFDAVRLTIDSLRGPDPHSVVEVLTARGLFLAAVTAHLNLLHDDREQREAARERLLAAIDLAAAVGAPVVVTHAGSFAPGLEGTRFYGQWSSPPGNPGDRSGEMVARFRKMYRPVVHRAEKRGIKIGLDVAVRMGNIACCPEMWERLLEAVPSEALGLSCDPSHWLWMGILPAEAAIRAFAGQWVYADVKDCEILPHVQFRQGIIGNQWWQYRVPGRGQLNWATLIGALTEAGYDYVLCVENEDRGLPGLPGVALGGRYLRQFLP
jgi:sugar phosphate isomerase/epimerase